MQRYASVWTGDNIASWEHLKLANIQCQRLATSGISFAGSDIGGFIETPTGELFIRWIQLGIFHPFCRVHSSGDHGEQEPWSFGEEYTVLFKKFVELRYMMLPYIYSSFWQYTEHGTPMLRPIAMIGQRDNEAHHRQDEFGLGDHMIVCPVNEEGADGRWMYLPKGDWYYYWTNELVQGGDEVWADADLERVPLYIQAGAVIPFYPIQQYVGEKDIKELTLHVYHKNGELSSEMYEDAGDGYDYEKGQSNLRSFSVLGTDKSLEITQEVSGKFKPSYSKVKVMLHGLPSGIKTANVDGKEVKLAKDNSVTVDVNFKEIHLG
jgi:alpha-glucosidase